MDTEYLKSILHYDQETGVFTWLVKRGRLAMPGRVAGTIKGKGERRIIIDGRGYYAHRLAWLYVYERWPVDQIDHADLNRDNNRIGNLREASQSQNQANKPRYRNNTTGFKGVTFNKRLGLYIAAVKHGRHTRHLGCFGDAAAAHAAYVAKAHELHGEFARAA